MLITTTTDENILVLHTLPVLPLQLSSSSPLYQSVAPSLFSPSSLSLSRLHLQGSHPSFVFLLLFPAPHHVSDFCQHLLREAAPRSIDGCSFSPKVLLYLLCFSLVTGFWVGFLRKSESMKCYRSFDFSEDCVLLVLNLGNYLHLMVWFFWESGELSVCPTFLNI